MAPALAIIDRLPWLSDAYDELSSDAFGLAFVITRDRGLAEDAVQEAFLSMWRNIDRFDADRGARRSLLLTMVRNKAVDAVRRRSGRRERSWSDVFEPTAPEAGPDEIVQGLMDRDRLRLALERIPAEQRITIMMAYFGGLTHKEIALELRIPVGTVKSRLRMGLEKLALRLHTSSPNYAAPSPPKPAVRAASARPR